MWNSLSKYREGALLFFRLALGTFFIWVHGWPKLAGGVTTWKKYGLTMKHIGIDFWPVFWGFMAAFSESIGCVLFALGLFFRPACLLLLITMTVAAIADYHGGGVLRASHAAEMAIVFFTFLFLGPGKYSIDKG